jgi:hypothetical protein
MREAGVELQRGVLEQLDLKQGGALVRNNGLAATPVLVLDQNAVIGGDRAYGLGSFSVLAGAESKSGTYPMLAARDLSDTYVVRVEPHGRSWGVVAGG